ncbi:MAG TPA: biopolymer transporter ExbD [Acidobacteriaceae bacterium]|jgi:biopolymer transport protein ExbD/biopolymer transport protein TolR
MGMANGVGTGRAVSGINVTPLIDVLLVLLIIFMVIVPAMPRGLNAVVPQPPKSDAPPPPSTVVVQVQANGTGELSYRINETVVPKAQLESQLAAIFATRQQKTLFVKADNSLEFSKIAEVIDMGHQAQVDTIGLLPVSAVAGR